MKFTLPVVCLALSIPTAVLAATSSGRLHGGGAGSIQAEKATAAEAAAAKAVRSLGTKVRCFGLYIRHESFVLHVLSVTFGVVVVVGCDVLFFGTEYSDSHMTCTTHTPNIKM